jgi:glycosyltransferase involved in cell wall biosynthesis
MVTLQAMAYAMRRRIPIGIQFAEDGPRMEGFGGNIRKCIAAFVLTRCSYAIGWTSRSANLARRLAPGVRVLAMPGTGVADSQIDLELRDDCVAAGRWFGDGSMRVAKLAFVARLVPEKGVADFMSICDALVGRLDLRVAIAGTGPCKQAVLAWARTRPWVTFHGLISRDDVSRCLGCADIALVPSRSTRNSREQFGKVALEAMAAGTPVIGYECGGLTELIGDGGLLVAEGDTGALEAKVEQYLRLPAAARDTARVRVRERASAFTDDKLADRLVELWHGVVNA